MSDRIDILLRTGKRRGEGIVGRYSLPPVEAMSLRKGETIRLSQRRDVTEYRINDVTLELTVADNGFDADITYVSLHVTPLK